MLHCSRRQEGAAAALVGARYSVTLIAMDLMRDERAALEEFVRWVRGRFDRRLRELALFGSRARGDGDEDSDLDVLVVIDEMTSSEGREIAHACGDLVTTYDVIVATFAVSTEHIARLRGLERRIAREIDRDAVPL